MMINVLTIDVEDYFQVNAFSGNIRMSDWDSYPLRVYDNTLKILDLLDSYNVKATFFVLGWIAERVPKLVGEIYKRGHEIASHGYFHEIVYNIGKSRFREDVRRAKQLLEDISGERVVGYRAPTYSITSKSFWAIDVLIEEGFSYDSSIFPVYHDTYGVPDAPRFPHLVEGTSGKLIEFPLTTYPLRIAGREYRVPVAGGGYLRLFPVNLISRCIEQINSTNGSPAVMYLHPWEIDPGQPRIKAGLKSRFRHYVNLSKTIDKLNYLLSHHRFGTMSQVLGNYGDMMTHRYVTEEAI